MQQKNKRSVRSVPGMKSVLVIAALAGISSAQASVVQFNTAGTGYSDAVAASSAIDLRGSGFVLARPNPTDPANFLFSERGAYELTQADGLSPLGSHDVTLTYSITGTVNPMTGVLSFSSGTFDLYSDATMNFGTASSNPSVVFGASDGVRIASFTISSGSGSTRGQVHLEGSANAGSILPGYFFSASGEDLSRSGKLQFGVDLGNKIDANPSPVTIAELACKASGFNGPGCNGSPYTNSPFYLLVSDGGRATISSPVPEPSHGALFLAGLGVLGLCSRRSRQQ